MKAPVIEKRFHDPNPVAALNRHALWKERVFCVSVVGGPGSGKTTLINETIDQLMPEIHVGVIACDITSYLDEDRISRHSEQVVQVNTGRGDQPDASHVRDALRRLDQKWLDLLLIENVGSLSLERPPDLGQDATAVLFSVAGGDDKAEKHPDLVRAADVVLLNKTDLLSSVPFDLCRFRQDVRRLNQRVEVIELSALRNVGVESWVRWLKARVGDAGERDEQG